MNFSQIMADLSIRVLNDDEEPLEGIGVGIEFTELIRGMAHESTDDEGYAYFSGYDEGPIRVYLDGKNCGKYNYVDGDNIDITK